MESCLAMSEAPISCALSLSTFWPSTIRLRPNFTPWAFALDNTCPICQAGYQIQCVNDRLMGAEGASAPFLRVPLADGTQVATSDQPTGCCSSMPTKFAKKG